MFFFQCFDVLRQTKKNCSDNVFIVDGDVSLPNLGLNDKDREMLVKEVDVIFHCAATVRFDEPLKQATYINVRAPMDLLRMAKEMKQLRVRLLHKRFKNTIFTSYKCISTNYLILLFYRHLCTCQQCFQIVQEKTSTKKCMIRKLRARIF